MEERRNGVSASPEVQTDQTESWENQFEVGKKYYIETNGVVNSAISYTYYKPTNDEPLGFGEKLVAYFVVNCSLEGFPNEFKTGFGKEFFKQGDKVFTKIEDYEKSRQINDTAIFERMGK